MQTPASRRWTVRSSRDLGRAIKAAREAAGLTQEQAAEAMSFNRSYLAMLEAGSDALVIERSLRTLRRLGATVTVTLPDDDVAT
jgi:transcriptional regulator with XRE-family HTH domain